MEIETPRLRLVPFGLEWLELAHADRLNEFTRAVKLLVPEAWPSADVAVHQFPQQLKALRADPNVLPWHGRLIVLKGPALDTLVGNINLKGPPDADGRVEIGFEVVPHFRRKGIASEAARELLGWCFKQVGVKAVRARTLKGNEISQALLGKLGFTRLGPQRDPQLGEMIVFEFTPSSPNG
jgi:[ribosomal protein S5]-alanine N-acetyltransferase